jgi:ABC-type transporter Mla subunit MlaD
MTTERWTDEMLDRWVSSVTSTMTQLTDLTEVNTRSIGDLGASVQRLTNLSEHHQTDLEQLVTVSAQHQVSLEQNEERFDRILTRIDEMQSEVRGLQTENRRILDQLINREGT